MSRVSSALRVLARQKERKAAVLLEKVRWTGCVPFVVIFLENGRILRGLNRACGCNGS